MNAVELGQRIKSKYPQYAQVDDAELGTRTAAKYPQYQIDDTPQQQTERPQFDPMKSLGQGMDILKGGFKRQMAAGPVSFNTITGGPATEFAHGVKTEAMTQAGVPEMVAESASGATDPTTILGSALTRLGSSKVLNPGALERLQGMKTSAKGRATVSRLLPAAKLSEDLEQGRPSGVQTEGFNIIKKTKNPQDIVNKFRNERDKVVSQVEQYVEQNNKPVSAESIRKRAEEILGKQFSNSSNDEVRSLQESISEELNHMPIDTKSANARKRFLYQKTENLQKAQRQGRTSVNRPEQALVEDAFAQAYKEAIEEAHPDIAPTNQRFGGLNEGVKASSKLVEGEVEQIPGGERVASQAIGRPSVGSMVAALIRELPFIGSSPKRLSGIIEKLNIKHGELLMSSREKQAPRLLGKQFFEPGKPTQTPYEPNNLGYKSPGKFQSKPPVETPYEPNELGYQSPGNIPKILETILQEEAPLGYKSPGKIGQVRPTETPYEPNDLGYISPGKIKSKPPIETPEEPYPGASYKMSLKELAKIKKTDPKKLQYMFKRRLR